MKVEIWSDVVCPWCYIGKRRFERALDGFEHRDEVVLVWRSFELDPSAAPSPLAPGDYVQHLARKYGVSPERAQQMIDNVTSVAADEALDLRFDIARRGNTFDAHRLLHLGLERGIQNDLKERLDHGTFTEGLAVSDHAELTEVAVSAGLDRGEVASMLASDRFADAVRADESQARAYGIHAVPFFVIDGKYGVAGAQTPEVLLSALQQAWDERSPLKLVNEAAGDVCDDDSCVV